MSTVALAIYLIGAGVTFGMLVMTPQQPDCVGNVIGAALWPFALVYALYAYARSNRS